MSKQEFLQNASMMSLDELAEGVLYKLSSLEELQEQLKLSPELVQRIAERIEQKRATIDPAKLPQEEESPKPSTKQLLEFVDNYGSKAITLGSIQLERSRHRQPPHQDNPYVPKELGINGERIFGFVVIWIISYFMFRKSLGLTFWATPIVAFPLTMLWHFFRILLTKYPSYAEYKEQLGLWEAKDRRLKHLSEVYSQGLPLIEQVREFIFYGVNTLFSIPINKDYIDEVTAPYMAQDLAVLLRVRTQQIAASRVQDRKGLLYYTKLLRNLKLKYFYLYSIPSEMGEQTAAYQEFVTQLSESNVRGLQYLRADKDEQQILSNKELPLEKEVKSSKKLLKINNMEPIIEALEEVKQYDTQNWIGIQSTSKLEEKTELLQQLCEAAQAEYKELSDLTEKLSTLLSYVRLCAYRNIYLGAELLSILTERSEGRSLTTQKDQISIAALDEDGLVELQSVELQSFDVVGSVATSLATLGAVFESDRDIRDFAYKNPKAAIGLAVASVALDAVFGWLDKRYALIDQHNQLQPQLIESINQMAEYYTEGQAKLFRIIELIKAITQSNKGFMAIYAPLRDKYLGDNLPAFSREELLRDSHELRRATQYYKNISQSKL